MHLIDDRAGLARADWAEGKEMNDEIIQALSGGQVIIVAAVVGLLMYVIGRLRRQH